jgi:hypothetical protein
MDSSTAATEHTDEHQDKYAISASAGDPVFQAFLNEWEETRRADCKKRNPRELTKCLLCNRVFTAKLYSRHV